MHSAPEKYPTGAGVGQRRTPSGAVGKMAPLLNPSAVIAAIASTSDTLRCVWVPLPIDRALSPNSSGHWSSRHTARQVARTATRYAASQAPYVWTDERDSFYDVSAIVFWPPGRKRMDDDNVKAALKPYLDGLQDGLGINDRRFLVGAVAQVRAREMLEAGVLLLVSPEGSDVPDPAMLVSVARIAVRGVGGTLR